MKNKNFYTHIEYFQNIGKNNFPEIPWERFSEYPFYLNDKEFEIVLGTNTSSFEKEHMVILFIDIEFPSNKKVFQYEFPKGICEVIVKSLEINFRKFSPFKRINILINILQEVQEIDWKELETDFMRSYIASIFIRSILKNMSISKSAALYLGTYIEYNEQIDVTYEELNNLNLEKDYLETLFDIESFINKVNVVNGSEIILVTLKEILYMVAQTLDKENFLSFFIEFKSNFLLSDKEVNKNYLFSDLMEYFWTAPAYRQKVVASRVFIPTEVFDLTGKIKNFIGTVEEMKQILTSIPFTKFPDNLRFKSAPNFREAMVDTSQIVGVYGHDSWQLDSNNKHMNTIFKYAKLFTLLGIDYSKGNPIKLISYKDSQGIEKYWVFHNGKYRISALLALGVDKIPVLVGDGEVV